ncbi:MAG TPA: shikimate kinase [Allosphingosinicella sp.]|nr:shikimate kinase [Allosphingosinicella sp.]
MAGGSNRVKKSIVLVGLMGAGKTTVGRRLAKRLGLSFTDSDVEIEAAAGLTIPEIFERFGEAHFRDGERRVIARLIEGPAKVIATGGGAFMNAETRALVLDRCTVVWLDGAVELLAERARRSGHRPLLDNDDPLGSLRAIAAVRNPVYAEAHLKVMSDRQRHEDTVEEIVALLRGA